MGSFGSEDGPLSLEPALLFILPHHRNECSYYSVLSGGQPIIYEVPIECCVQVART